MTERIREFLRGPSEKAAPTKVRFFVVDLDVVRGQLYGGAFAKGVARHRGGVLRREGQPGAGSARAARRSSVPCFDTASVAEIEMALGAGASPLTVSPLATPPGGARRCARLPKPGVRLDGGRLRR